MSKLVFISDTHMQMSKVDIPDGDVLIHCGDALSFGRDKEFFEFAEELANLSKRFQKVLYIPGNHDETIQFGIGPTVAREHLAKISNGKIKLLVHQAYTLEINGAVLRCFGSPWTPKFGNWAYGYPKDYAESMWRDIPENTDIVFTHGAVYGIMDTVSHLMYDEVDSHVGCKALRERIDAVKPKVYAGGHLHLEGGKWEKHGETLFINAAICDDHYEPTRRPIVVDTQNWEVVED